jgi:hypothetical protein
VSYQGDAVSQDEFTKLFRYMTERFDKIDQTLARKADAADLDRAPTLLDKILKQQEVDEDERLVMGHQLDRLDRWVHELADKIGYKLTA